MQSQFKEKHIKEAEERGLVMIGKGRTKNHYKYKFISCGHEHEFQPANVRRGKILCTTCYNDKLNSDAAATGLEILDCKPTKNFYRKCRFISCGHLQDIHIGSIRENTATCTECQANKLKEEARLVGLEIVGLVDDMGYRKYRFTKCGHEQDIPTQKVRENVFRCRQCLENTHKSEAEANGLILIGDSSNKDSRKYRFKSCGHEQDIVLSIVRKGEARCKICNVSPWSDPSYLYILKIVCDDFSWLKIGHAKNIEKRIKHYGLPENAYVDILFSRLYSNAYYSVKDENRLHKLFKPSQISPDIMRKYHTVSGHTECFDCSIDLSEVL